MARDLCIEGKAYGGVGRYAGLHEEDEQLLAVDTTREQMQQRPAVAPSPNERRAQVGDPALRVNAAVCSSQSTSFKASMCGAKDAHDLGRHLLERVVVYDLPPLRRFGIIIGGINVINRCRYPDLQLGLPARSRLHGDLADP